MRKRGKEVTREEVWERYVPYLKKLAEKFGGVERGDCLQEGLLGGLRAIRTYKSNKGKTLDQWVELCASNQMRKY